MTELFFFSVMSELLRTASRSFQYTGGGYMYNRNATAKDDTPDLHLQNIYDYWTRLSNKTTLFKGLPIPVALNLLGRSSI